MIAEFGSGLLMTRTGHTQTGPWLAASAQITSFATPFVFIGKDTGSVSSR
jgi:hypothetical protein